MSPFAINICPFCCVYKVNWHSCSDATPFILELQYANANHQTPYRTSNQSIWLSDGEHPDCQFKTRFFTIFQHVGIQPPPGFFERSLTKADVQAITEHAQESHYLLKYLETFVLKLLPLTEKLCRAPSSVHLYHQWLSWAHLSTDLRRKNRQKSRRLTNFSWRRLQYKGNRVPWNKPKNGLPLADFCIQPQLPPASKQVHSHVFRLPVARESFGDEVRRWEEETDEHGPSIGQNCHTRHSLRVSTSVLVLSLILILMH